MNKKLISILLSLVMVLGTVAVGFTAFAAEGYTQVNNDYHINASENKLEPHVYGAYDASTGTAVCTLCDYVHSCRENGHVDADENCVCDLCGEESHIDKNVQDHYCDRCGAYTHTWLLHEHADATCDSGDYYVYRCLTCGYAHEETIGENTGTYNHDENGTPLVYDNPYGDSKGVFQTIKIIPGYTMALGHYFDFSSENVKITWSGLESESANPYIRATGEFKCARCGFTVTVSVENLEETSSGKIEILSELAEPTCQSGITQYKATFKVPEGNDPSMYKVYTDTQVSNYGKLTDHVPAEAVEENRVEPTCTKDGSYDSVIYCKFYDICGTELSREKVIIPATGHTPDAAVEENRVEPTCTEEGKYDTVVYCSVCGDEISRKTIKINPLGHTPSEAVEENRVDPTCTEEGKYDSVVYCSVCGDEISREEKSIDPLGHTPAEAVHENEVEPTCGDEGSYDSVVYCSVCGDEISRETIAIPATGNHDFNNLGFCKVCGAHDCENFGHSYVGGFEADDTGHWKVCAYCGAISSDGDPEPDGQIGEHVDNNTDGMCDICGYSSGHKWQLINHADPSCTTTGYDEYKCTFHEDETKKVEIPAIGHYWYDDSKEEDRQYVDFEFSSNFESCTLTFKCRRPECGHTVSYTVYTSPSDVGAVLASAKTKKAIAKQVPPDCESGSGLRYYAIFTISGVLREMNLDITPATEDQPGMSTINQMINSDPALQDIVNTEGLDPGINANELGFICMYTIEDGAEPALGHIYEDKDQMRYKNESGEWVEGPNYHPNGDATCGKDGTRTATCDRCGKLSDNVPDVGSALEHVFSDPEVTPATCTEPGLERGECTRCHLVTENVLPALGHDFDPSTEKTVAPTCTEQGYSEGYCTRCGQTVKGNYVPALGHDLGDWVTYKDAVCDKDRVERRYCSRCDYYEEREIPGSAPGHSYKYEYIDENRHGLVCETCGSTAGRSEAHIDADYNFVCDYCNHELDFWHHWMHYMVGLPTYGFSGFTNMVMTFFTKMVNFFTQYMINF